MSDTPKTDSLLKVNIPELVDLFRELERDLMEEYSDRESQYGGDYCWEKHENTELIKAICKRLIEWENNKPKP